MANLIKVTFGDSLDNPVQLSQVPHMIHIVGDSCDLSYDILNNVRIWCN